MRRLDRDAQPPALGAVVLTIVTCLDTDELAHATASPTLDKAQRRAAEAADLPKAWPDHVGWACNRVGG